MNLKEISKNDSKSDKSLSILKYEIENVGRLFENKSRLGEIFQQTIKLQPQLYKQLDPKIIKLLNQLLITLKNLKYLTESRS